MIFETRAALRVPETTVTDSQKTSKFLLLQQKRQVIQAALCARQDTWRVEVRVSYESFGAGGILAEALSVIANSREKRTDLLPVTAEPWRFSAAFSFGTC